jgi:hypothetical protein
LLLVNAFLGAARAEAPFEAAPPPGARAEGSAPAESGGGIPPAGLPLAGQLAR